MTKVANSVIVADLLRDSEARWQITEKVFVRRDGLEQSFLEVHMNGHGDDEYADEARLAGGSVFFENNVYAAAFNHIEPEVIADWFEQLPWQSGRDNASLTIHGNDFSLYVLVVDGATSSPTWNCSATGTTR